MSIEAMKQALEYLRENQHHIADNERHTYVMEYNAFIEKLEQAIAEAEKQEPVAVVDEADDCKWATILPDVDVKVGQLLYAEAPQQRELVGLPDRLKLEMVRHAHKWTTLELIEEVENSMKRVNQ